MARIVALPERSPTASGGERVAWIASEGDRVAPGAPVARVEAGDRALDVPGPDGEGGIVLKRLVEIGDPVAAGTPLVILGEAGEDIGPLLAEAAATAWESEPPAGARGEEIGPGTALAVVPPSPIARPPGEGDHVDRPLPVARRRLADRLTAAKREVPHLYLHADVNAGALLVFRDRLNRMLEPQSRASVGDLVIKGAALALRRVPQLNASFLGTAIRYYTRVHVGVSIAVGDDLITPVIRDADLKGIGVLGNETRELSERAGARRLTRDDLRGSTFTISDLGSYGIDHFQAIVNPPESAILAVGRVRREPVAQGDGVAIGQRVALTLSCDHRVVNGAVGARFLGELTRLLESPESLAL